jgi:tetratricopeptide (TPR) repeat protein
MEWIVELLGDLERWSEQKPYIDRLLKLDPDNITYNLQLANIHLQAGENNTARRIFRRVIKLAGDNKDALIRLGVVLIYNDEPELAELCYRRAVDLDPVDDRAHFTLGQIYLTLDRERDAVKHIEMAIAVNDTVVRYWTTLAFLGMDAGQYLQSEEILRRALNAIPDHPRLLDLLGSVLERQERYQEALDVLYRSVEVDSTSIAPYITIGFIYDETDRFEMAESAYQDALNIDPENPTLLNNYAYLLAARGVRLDEALTMSEKVMEIDPENSSYLDTIGWIYYKQGNPEQALEYLLKALEITDEDNAELLDHIGDVYFDLDEHEIAQDYWQRALDIEPDNQTIKDKLNQPTMIHN